MIFSRLSSMHLFHSHDTNDKLRCPYKGCEKQFDRPTMITDDSVIPRQTHYACPYCMSRLELDTVKEKIVGVRATEYPMVFDSPAKCAHFSGLLNTPSGSTDECLICPKVLQCNVRKK
jgi:DNA-directed RNA polymerase subunit RPC12/RpoP